AALQVNRAARVVDPNPSSGVTLTRGA
ncbi:MAG: hypothetical protein QOI78_1, partial [Actinomycetota bacterium]|nr:hypothetical protein [Actinomycetota bacterium]